MDITLDVPFSLKYDVVKALRLGAEHQTREAENAITDSARVAYLRKAADLYEMAETLACSGNKEWT